MSAAMPREANASVVGEASSPNAPLQDTADPNSPREHETGSASNANEYALIAQLTADLNQANAALFDSRSALRSVKNSFAWKLTVPLRVLIRFYRQRLRNLETVRAVPGQSLRYNGEQGAFNWSAVGADPYFFLMPADSVKFRDNCWAVLEMRVKVSRATTIQVSVGVAGKFSQERTAHTSVEHESQVQIPLFLPVGFDRLRLEPNLHDADVDLRNLVLRYQTERPQNLTAVAPAASRPQSDGESSSYRPLGVALDPINQLVPIDDGGNTWQSTGDDPFFMVRDYPIITSGWARIELEIEISSRSGLAKFYLDCGEGFSETTVVCLPYISSEATSRIFRVAGPIAALRFDPLERPGKMELNQLAIKELSHEDALASMRATLMIEAEKSGSAPSTTSESRNESEEDVMASYSALFKVDQALLGYHDWIELNEKPTEPTQKALEAFKASHATLPLISVIVPTYETPYDLLHKCIESVLHQSMPNWQLCIADDASSQPHVRELIEFYTASDTRIKAVFRSTNGHISECSNSAIALADGSFLALLDHDDLLHPHAIYYVTEAIVNNPEAHVIYSDEDKIDEAGARTEPHFKSNWNPELFFAQNYVSHLGVYRKSVIEEIGGFRAGVEGSQDYDLMLRALQVIPPNAVHHIPRVLYHWRAIAGSTAASAEGKSYTTDAGKKALHDFFESDVAGSRFPKPVHVSAGAYPNTYRLTYPTPAHEPLVSIIIPTKDAEALTRICVESILSKTTYQNFEILIVDNGSVEPETFAFFDAIQALDGRVKVIKYNAPFNYSAINNFAVEHAIGEYVALVNNDIEVITPEWLSEMLGHACQEAVGCVGAKLYYANDTVQHAGVICGLGGVAGHSHKHFDRNHPGYFYRLVLPQTVSAVTAACLLVRKAVFLEVGGLDAVNLTIAFNDVDFCLKVKAAGYRNVFTPYAELYHHESVSRGQEDSPSKLARFQSEIAYMKQKWRDVLNDDPYYSPNLTKAREDFTI